MSSKLLLTAKLDQRLMMNQKLKEMINFLQYTTIEIKQKITEFIESNPLLEVQEEAEGQEEEHEEIWSADYQLSNKNQYRMDSLNEDHIQNIPNTRTLRDVLIEQTLNCHFNEIEQEIAIAMIDALDDDGFMAQSPEEIQSSLEKSEVDSVHIDKKTIQSVLNVLQTFEPLGIAAKDAKESLLIQIKAKDDGSAVWQYARKICEQNAMTESNMDLKRLSKLTNLNQEEIMAGLSLINQELDFHPAKNFVGQSINNIEPELYVKKVGNKWRVYLTKSILTRLDVNPEYRKLIKEHSRDKNYKSLLTQLQEANLLISGIRRRNDTLLAAANYIVETQQDYFEQGNAALKPVNLAQAANAIGAHESTLSRITNGKYMATPHGIVELKFFFPSHVETDVGESKSSTAIKTFIQEIISSENSTITYSDDDIAEKLRTQGIRISRRTITKYREAMNIPSSYQRQHVNNIKK